MKNIDNPTRGTYYFYTWRPIDNSIPFDYIYVGSTSNVKSRKYKYKIDCQKVNENSRPIIKVLTKYGWDKFEMRLIGMAENMTITEARIKEQEYIDDIKKTKHVSHQDEEYAETGDKVLLNAVGAYNELAVKKSTCITQEDYIENGRRKFNLKVNKYQRILDIINNSQMCETEWLNKTGEIQKIEYYGLPSSSKEAVNLHFMKRNYVKLYIDNDFDEEPRPDIKEWYEYNCPIIRTEWFDNRDRQSVLEHLQRFAEELEQDELE